MQGCFGLCAAVAIRLRSIYTGQAIAVPVGQLPASEDPVAWRKLRQWCFEDGPMQCGAPCIKSSEKQEIMPRSQSLIKLLRN
ncbi:hypothetical protein NC653_004969 [Populus alba x Populus x berolinensis]|uniref:Uncharacterized protein n=1 Tax=Populus alba x Populus x berolinensis TaxID=444605 RepID=A0AAD6WB93_9ROSI|nr:hypothetical protein NC653_004969 [Populus alba x Populus x berolinensis]